LPRKLADVQDTRTGQLLALNGITQDGAFIEPDGILTIISLLVVPPGPLHDNLYKVLTVGVTVVTPGAFSMIEPDQPPEAVQELAPELFQLNTDELPGPIKVGTAVKVTSGGLTVTFTVLSERPPGPLHSNL